MKYKIYIKPTVIFEEIERAPLCFISAEGSDMEKDEGSGGGWGNDVPHPQSIDGGIEDDLSLYDFSINQYE